MCSQTRWLLRVFMVAPVGRPAQSRLPNLSMAIVIGYPSRPSRAKGYRVGIYGHHWSRFWAKDSTSSNHHSGSVLMKSIHTVYQIGPIFSNARQNISWCTWHIYMMHIYIHILHKRMLQIFNYFLKWTCFAGVGCILGFPAYIQILEIFIVFFNFRNMLSNI